MFKKFDELDVQRRLADRHRIISKKKFYLFYQNYWNKIIFESAAGHRESFVLDCGCGIGQMLSYLSGSFNHVYGIDLSEDALRLIYKASNDAKKVARGNMHRIAFKDEVFDIVVCKGSLHHLMEPEKALKEIYRILKKGGSLLLSEPCRDSAIWRKIGLFYVRLSKKFSSHHRLFYSEELKELLTQNGFRIQKSRYFGFAALPLCGIAYQFPVMPFIPFNYVLSKILVKIDEIAMKIPLIKKLNWHIIIHSKKSSS